MKLFFATTISLLLSGCLWSINAQRQVASVLTVANGGRMGQWGGRQFCPSGFATAFSLQTDSIQEGRRENLVIRGVRLHCSDGTTVTSSTETRGRWSAVNSCRGNNRLSSFSLGLSTFRRQTTRVTERVASSLQFRCSDGMQLRGYGYASARFSRWSNSCRQGVCGLQTRVDSQLRIERRESAVTDMRLFCC